MSYDKTNHNYRELITGVDTKIPLKNGKLVTAINFDNAATTPPFNYVMEKVVSFSPYYSSIHRGTGFKSTLSSEIYETSRQLICNFVHCDSEKNTVIYVKNTTEAINKLSYIFNYLYKDAVILATRMEHHSNDLPWRNKFKVDYLEVDETGKLIISDLRRKLEKHDGKVKLVCVTGASNVTGYKNPIYKIAKIAHNYGSEILVDGAQLVPHYPIYMKQHYEDESIDYLAFSAHKMYAPFGIGVLIGPKETFCSVSPEYIGGGTIKLVTDNSVIWNDPPEKNEAGTPNVLGVIALTAAIEMLNKLEIKNIDSNEMKIYNYALNKITSLPNITLYCDPNPNCDKVAILPFNIKGLYHGITAKLLSDLSGISVRSGCFCAQPYVQRLLRLSRKDITYLKHNYNDISHPGLVRLSFGLYNTYSEVDILIDTLKEIIRNKT
ncbi:aminotransferase class V-fold PLP-dependent enzyme [Clostridium coskatii]|uniref:Cysteine desulfurase SufS n=1 Tax=Clostridium coskatii TaxID=1705578 RepID=A0A166U7B1_9CLOT|nr:aminotransferase class V-fold PLP-dependent enzyme [Clostridium coskatii]OAA94643.1 putative cysteine desulfurase [Clostridium coskatii]OBR93451.1 cysteine desulfurase SufS [Clostridium coskatii]